MPFTPYHFGPSALVGLPLKKWIDIPVFVLANVVVDLEPGAVMVFGLNYPLHGYLHTFLIGGFAGLIWGLAAYPLRPLFAWIMNLFRLGYKPTLAKMMFSGAIGAVFHILVDSFLYKEMNPFWPMTGNPLLGVLRCHMVYFVCKVSVVVALVLYPVYAFVVYKREKKRLQS